MDRVLGVNCSSEQIYLAVAEDGAILAVQPERLTTAGLLEESERLVAMQDDVRRALGEIRPREVRIMRPEQKYEGSYGRIAPRATLETIVRLASVEAGVSLEMLYPASVRSRLGLPRTGPLKSHVPRVCEPVGKYWNAGRNLAAVAALAET